jgi:hypothetical protein
MPFVLVFIGVVLLVVAIRNTQSDLFALVKGDFTGSANYLYWFITILIVGAVGYIPKLKPFSVAFLTLIIMVLILKRGDPSQAAGGFFQKFTQALGTTTNPQAGAPQSSTSLGQSPNPSGTATGNNLLNQLQNASPFK